MSGSKIVIIKITKIAEDIIIVPPVFQVHFVNGDWSREVDRTGPKHQRASRRVFRFSSFVMAPAASSAPPI